MDQFIDKFVAQTLEIVGRIADTGRDPAPMMATALEICRRRPKQELIWASPRELPNIARAEKISSRTIAVTPNIRKKPPLIGKSLEEYSLNAVKMFYSDARRQTSASEPERTSSS